MRLPTCAYNLLFSNESRRALGGGGRGGDGDGGVVNAGFFLAKCGQIFISSQLSRNIKFVMYITQTVFFYM